MFESKHPSFEIKTFPSINVTSPLVVIDPYDEDFRAEITNTKHGLWDIESAFFNDSYNQYELTTRINIHKCAYLLAERVSEIEEYKSLVSAFKGKYGRNTLIQEVLEQYKDNALIQECITLVTEYLLSIQQNVPLTGFIKDYNQYISVVFHDAVNVMGMEYSENEEKTIAKMWETAGVKDTSDEIKRSFKNNVLPTAFKTFQETMDKTQKAIDDRYPRSVQYLRLKHSEQAEFTPLDSIHWEEVATCETNSGQLGIVTSQYLSAVGEKELQLQLSKIANDIQLVDGERVNMSMMGAFEHGANCMTPIREMYGDAYGILNNSGEVIEIMIHFDLKP